MMKDQNMKKFLIFWIKIKEKKYLQVKQYWDWGLQVKYVLQKKEGKEIENNSKYYDLESFINLCQEKIEYNDIETNLISIIKSFESKEKPGYIKKQKIFVIIKKFDFDRKLKEKMINELVREVSNDVNEDYIDIETLVKEFLSN